MPEKYIGGEFIESDADAFRLPEGTTLFGQLFPGSRNGRTQLMLESGADALAHILCSIAPRQELALWVPENFCYESLERVQLKVNAQGTRFLICRYQEPAAALTGEKGLRAFLYLHDNIYQPAPGLIAQMRQAGIITIEDFVQAPLEAGSFIADYAFNSFRKLGPFRASVAYSDQAKAALSDTESEYHQTHHRASELKAAFLQAPDADAELETEYLKLYREAAESLAAPDIYKARLEEIKRLQSTDLIALRQYRSANYEYLAHALSQVPQLRVQKGSYMYFIVETDSQAALRSHCFRHGIFPAIHWADSCSAAGRTRLSFAVDQRYNHEDMARIAETVLRFFREQS